MIGNRFADANWVSIRLATEAILLKVVTGEKMTAAQVRGWVNANFKVA